MQLYGKVTDLLSRLGETPENFTGRILFLSLFNDISCDKKDNEEECLANARVVKVLARKFGVGQWSFIGPGSEKKWSSGEENSPQGAWDHIAEKMLLIRRKWTSHFRWNSQKADARFCEQRLHCPEKLCKEQWSFIGLGSEKKRYSMKKDSPQEIWDKLAEKC